MPLEPRHGLGDIGPFGEAFTPPGVVLRNGVKLRKIKSDQPDKRFGCQGRNTVFEMRPRRGIGGNLAENIQRLHPVPKILRTGTAPAAIYVPSNGKQPFQ